MGRRDVPRGDDADAYFCGGEEGDRPGCHPGACPGCGPPVAAPAALPDTGYRIGPGDVLNIEVWKDPVLTRLVTVLPDGRIAYPLVGEIVAADKTLFQLKKEIEGKLARYLQDAVITVEVRQMNGLQIYVLGRVNAPGRTILSTNVNVLQALAIAGGPNAFANKSRIRIFREEGGKTLSLPFDYDDVTAGKNTESNIRSGGGT